MQTRRYFWGNTGHYAAPPDTPQNDLELHPPMHHALFRSHSSSYLLRYAIDRGLLSDIVMRAAVAPWLPVTDIEPPVLAAATMRRLDLHIGSHVRWNETTGTDKSAHKYRTMGLEVVTDIAALHRSWRMDFAPALGVPRPLHAVTSLTYVSAIPQAKSVRLPQFDTAVVDSSFVIACLLAALPSLEQLFVTAYTPLFSPRPQFGLREPWPDQVEATRRAVDDLRLATRLFSGELSHQDHPPVVARAPSELPPRQTPVPDERAIEEVREVLATLPRLRSLQVDSVSLPNLLLTWFPLSKVTTTCHGLIPKAAVAPLLRHMVEFTTVSEALLCADKLMAEEREAVYAVMSSAAGPFSLHQTLTHLTLNPAKCWPGNDLFWTLASDVAAFPTLTELCATLPFHTRFPSRSVHALERALRSAPTVPLTAPGDDIDEGDDGARLAGLGDAMVLSLRQFYGSSLQRAPDSMGQCELDFVRPLTMTSFESAFQWSLCSVGTRADIVARVIRSADLEETLASGCVSVATVACIAGSTPFHDAPENFDERQFEEAARRFILRAHCCACDIIGVLTALLRERTDSVGAVTFKADETYVLDDAGDVPAAWAMPVVPKRAAHNAFTRLSSPQREVLSACVRRQEYPGLLIPLLSLGWHTPKRRYHLTSPLSGVLGAVLAFFHGLRKAIERGSHEE